MAENRYLRTKDGKFAGSLASPPKHIIRTVLSSNFPPPLFEYKPETTQNKITAAHQKYMDKVGIEDAVRATLSGEKEDQILKLFPEGDIIEFKGRSHVILESDKPFSQNSKGEPKTDIYIKLKDRMSGEVEEVKLTYKSSNYQFLENKMSGSRFFAIFSEEEQKEILTLLPQNDRVNREFEIETSALLNPESKLTLGYRLDIMSSDAAGYMAMDVSRETMSEIIAGNKLDDEKKHGVVNGEIVQNSGVANYILIGEDFSDANEVLSKMVSVSDYVDKDENRLIALAPKAVNMIPSRAKAFGGDKVKPWDGNRPLAVSMTWVREGDKLVAKPEVNTLFNKWAHQVGDALLIKVIEAVEDAR
jgi:hypothetical protein